MFYKILLSFFLAAFISACSTTPKDTAGASGSGSASSASSDPSSGDSDILADLENTELGGPNVEPGSQEDLVVNVGDRIFFDYDSSELDADAKELLQDQAAWIKQHNVSITIEGHCDERGTREYNLALGEKRAQSVKEFLIVNGISSSKIDVVSYGEERPDRLGSSESAYKANRRVEISLY
jgi:peptidoglycan-associated lipoprotein